MLRTRFKATKKLWYPLPPSALVILAYAPPSVHSCPCLLGSAAAVSRHCCASGHGFWRGLRRTTTTLTKQGRARAARRYRVALAALPSSPPHKIAQSHSRTPLPPLFSARCEGKLRSQPPPSVPLAALTEGGALAKQTKVLVQPQPAT